MSRVRFFSSDIARRYLPRRSIRLITQLLRLPGSLLSSDDPAEIFFCPIYPFFPPTHSFPANPDGFLSRLPAQPYVVSRVSVPLSVPFPPVFTCFRSFSPVATGSRCCLALLRNLLLPLGSRCCTTSPETRCHPSPVFFRGRCTPGPVVPRAAVSPLYSLDLPVAV